MRSIVIVILMLILVSCTGGRSRSGFFWSHTDGAFDTLTFILEKSWYMDANAEELRVLTNRLESLALADKTDKNKAARSHFFRARWMSAFSTYDEVYMELHKAEKLWRDSTAYPYEWNRMKYIRSVDPKLPTDRQYFMNKELCGYFDKKGDSLMKAVTMANIANALININDSVASQMYFEMGISTLRRLGMDAWCRKFSLSLAQAYRHSDMRRSDSIMSVLLSDSRLKKDSIFYNVVLHNAFLFSHDISYIRQGYPLICNRARFLNGTALYEGYLADHYLKEGQIDSAVICAKSLLRKISDQSPYSTRLTVLPVCAKVFEAIDDRDSAFLLMKEYVSVLDTFSKKTLMADLQRNEMRQKIALTETQARERRIERRSRYGIASLAVILIAMLLVFMFYRRNKRLEMHRVRNELEITRHRFHLASSAVVIEEKDKALESVMDTVNSLSKENKISRPDAGMINGVLKIHLSNKNELETFQEIHEKLDPDFSRKLKQNFPHLTENNLKIASYISIGMSNKQIARVMRIDYKSVITSRHRLRTKMGLDKEESLEDALRKYSGL